MTTKLQIDRLNWLGSDNDRLVSLLPHGSGIDASWNIWQLVNRNVTCSCSYHGMNEYGYYDGWQDFKITIHPIPYVTTCPYCNGKGWRSIQEIAKIRKCRVSDIDKTALAKVWINPTKTRFQCSCIQYGYNPAILDFRLHFTGYRQRKNWVYGLRDYLEETIQYTIGGLLLCKSVNE